MPQRASPQSRRPCLAIRYENSADRPSCLCRRKGVLSRLTVESGYQGTRSSVSPQARLLGASSRRKDPLTTPTGMLLLGHPSSQGSDQIVHVLELGSSRRTPHVCAVVANCCRERLGRTVPCCTGSDRRGWWRAGRGDDVGWGGRWGEGESLDWTMRQCATAALQLYSQEIQAAVPCCGC